MISVKRPWVHVSFDNGFLRVYAQGAQPSALSQSWGVGNGRVSQEGGNVCIHVADSC